MLLSNCCWDNDKEESFGIFWGWDRTDDWYFPLFLGFDKNDLAISVADGLDDNWVELTVCFFSQT